MFPVPIGLMSEVADVGDFSSSLLIHTNQTSGSAVDSSSYGHIITQPAGVNFAAQAGPFSGDTGSLLFDGDSTDYISMPDSAAWPKGLGDWSYDWWQRVNNTSTGHGIFQQFLNTSERTGVTINDAHKFNFFTTSAQAGSNISLFSDSPQQLNTWQHLQIARQAGTFYMFAGGVLIGTHGAQTSDPLPDIAGEMRIGKYTFGGGSHNMSGYMAEMRLLIGSAAFDNSDDSLYCTEGVAANGYANGVPTQAYAA